MRMLFLSLLVAALTTQVGCSQDTGDRTSKLRDLETKIRELETKVNNLSWNQTLNDLGEIAFLTPGGDGYSIIKTNIGNLTVSLEDIKPYANGSRVTLTFGNTTSATINGIKAKIDWGSVGKTGAPNNDTAKSKEITLTKSLLPGRWTKVSLVLEGVPPAELGFVRLREVSHDGIRLLLN